MSKNRLIIFTRNPELGKVKSRLAKTIGDSAALEIYKFLIDHTQSISREVECDKVVYYSEYIPEKDNWDTNLYDKALQRGEDLGACMKNAFRESFEAGYTRVVIIGSDIFDLNSADITSSFEHLANNDYVIGPAQDGGYYLLGMKELNPDLFEGINWGTETVLQSTLESIGDASKKLLDFRNDIDYFEDIKDEPVFHQFIKHIKVV